MKKVFCSIMLSYRVVSVSDWRSRRDSSAASTEPDTSSEAEETSEKEEKPSLQSIQRTEKSPEKPSQISWPKTTESTWKQTESVTHSTPNFGFGGIV